jgi:hypothetical protein
MDKEGTVTEIKNEESTDTYSKSKETATFCREEEPAAPRLGGQ